MRVSAANRDLWRRSLRFPAAGRCEKPIYPKNLYLKREPMKHAEYRQKVIKRQVRFMHDRGIWKKPERQSGPRTAEWCCVGVEVRAEVSRRRPPARSPT